MTEWVQPRGRGNVGYIEAHLSSMAFCYKCDSRRRAEGVEDTHTHTKEKRREEKKTKATQSQYKKDNKTKQDIVRKKGNAPFLVNIDY